MTDKEALLLALEALHYCEALNRDVDERKMQAITVIRKLWTEHAMQERGAWQKQLTNAQRNELKQIEDGTWEADRNG